MLGLTGSVSLLRAKYVSTSTFGVSSKDKNDLSIPQDTRKVKCLYLKIFSTANAMLEQPKDSRTNLSGNRRNVSLRKQVRISPRTLQTRTGERTPAPEDQAEEEKGEADRGPSRATGTLLPLKPPDPRGPPEPPTLQHGSCPF